jgi:hypothetical protein
MKRPSENVTSNANWSSSISWNLRLNLLLTNLTKYFGNKVWPLFGLTRNELSLPEDDFFFRHCRP